MQEQEGCRSRSRRGCSSRSMRGCRDQYVPAGEAAEVCDLAEQSGRPASPRQRGGRADYCTRHCEWPGSVRSPHIYTHIAPTPSQPRHTLITITPTSQSFLSSPGFWHYEVRCQQPQDFPAKLHADGQGQQVEGGHGHLQIPIVLLLHAISEEKKIKIKIKNED